MAKLPARATRRRELVDVLVLLLQPETGDDLQWEKAGLLEVAAVIVIHKADLPGAERVEAQVLSTLTLSMAPAPLVLRVSARSGVGLAELWAAIAVLPLRRGSKPGDDDLPRLAQATLAARFAAARREADQEVSHLLSSWQRGEVDGPTAGAALLHHLATKRASGV